jgi:2-oxoglutarate ferredoxin oxidoreductase subunit delta
MAVKRVPYDLEKFRVPRGEVHIIAERCKGCGFCVEYCSRQVLEVSDEFNAKGYHPPRVARPERCVHCGFCQMICPEFAIWSTLQGETVPIPEVEIKT